MFFPRLVPGLSPRLVGSHFRELFPQFEAGAVVVDADRMIPDDAAQKMAKAAASRIVTEHHMIGNAVDVIFAENILPEDLGHNLLNESL